MRGAAKLLVLVLSTGVLSLTAFNSAADAQALKYCKADAARLCKGIKEGGGRIARCLKAHENEVSIGCGKELKRLKNEM